MHNTAVIAETQESRSNVRLFIFSSASQHSIHRFTSRAVADLGFA